MKKLVCAIVLVIAVSPLFAQEMKPDSTLVQHGKEQTFEEKVLKILNYFYDNERLSADKVYKLYPTKNMWTFLKLDTTNGRIWQVQYSVDGDEYRFESVLNGTSLVGINGWRTGRFELYQTENIHNFILLDQETGRCWQIQWGKAESRQVIRIY